SPGDPASSPLDQWEEHSAKIVFENPHGKRAVSDVCLDHSSFESARRRRRNSNLDVVV
ncbi:hypothetical protein C8J57DRAFT_1050724, partial [Mycena rebaudengoi]